MFTTWVDEFNYSFSYCKTGSEQILKSWCMKQKDELILFTIFALKITLCAEETVQLVKALLCQHQDLSSNPRAKVLGILVLWKWWQVGPSGFPASQPRAGQCLRKTPGIDPWPLSARTLAHISHTCTHNCSFVIFIWDVAHEPHKEPSNQSGIYLYYDRIAPLKFYLII